MGVPTRLVTPAVALAFCGCVLPSKFLTHQPPRAPAQVVAAWNNAVMHVPDPAHGGTPAPGIAGRVYLFGPTADVPFFADGQLVVDLYDASAAEVKLEEWRFDSATLQRLVKKDIIGDGYTVFLPWGTYRPDIRQVRLSTKFEPAGGSPLYAHSQPMKLDHGSSGPETKFSQRTEVYPQLPPR